VFITYDASVKLIDFGIARAKGRIAQTTLGRIKGKFSYMAPEQVLGKDFDHRADIFALGATLYEAALGARLFAGVDESETLHKLLFEEVPDIQSRVPSFPEELSKILQRTLASNPDDRQPNAEEVARELDAWIATQGGDPKAELRELLARLFETERQEENKAIESLRADQTPTVAPPPDAGQESLTGTSGYRTLPVPSRRRRIGTLVALGVGAVALVAVGVALSSRPAPTPAAPAISVSAAPLSTSVVVEVVTQPAVDAKITLDGVPLTGKPARISHARGTESLTLVVEADGYQPARLEIQPDRDRSVVVPMIEKPPPPPPSAEPKKGTGAKPGAPHVPGTSKGKGKGKGDPLVTDYPF
jgi:serine/threonine-protein kinase